MLKHALLCKGVKCKGAATFGWLCVETNFVINGGGMDMMQPPSGGCVLKHR